MFGTLCELSGGASVLEGDLGGGVRASNPDAKPTLERLALGDALMVDIYSGVGGYFADTTRNFVVGEPSGEQKAIHAILEEALAAGEGALRPGMRACDVDAVVRGVIGEAGYASSFPHHSGHAYGLFQQERPFLIPAEIMPLEAGMIVTLEPGIYIEGWGGMRLEGNYLITDSGFRRLDRYPSRLIVC
jgi:Xaa-Pro aminopeptidase